MLVIKGWTGKMCALLLNGIEQLMTTDIPETCLRIPEISLPPPSPRRVPRLYAPSSKTTKRNYPEKNYKAISFPLILGKVVKRAFFEHTSGTGRRKTSLGTVSRGLPRVNPARPTWLSSVVRLDLWMRREKRMSFTSNLAEFLTLSHTKFLFPS